MSDGANALVVMFLGTMSGLMLFLAGDAYNKGDPGWWAAALMGTACFVVMIIIWRLARRWR